MRKSFLNPLPNAPQPVGGEIIPLTRPFQSILGIVVGIMFIIPALGAILGFLLFDVGSWPLLALVVVQILVGVFFIRWEILEQKSSLVLGDDRMQCLRGKRVLWELPYDNIAEVKLFTHGVIPIQSLGINLIASEIFDHAWPSWARTRKWNQSLRGFDFHIPTTFTPEPPDRLLDVFLTSYHRFKAKSGADSSPTTRSNTDMNFHLQWDAGKQPKGATVTEFDSEKEALEYVQKFLANANFRGPWLP